MDPHFGFAHTCSPCLAVISSLISPWSVSSVSLYRHSCMTGSFSSLWRTSCWIKRRNNAILFQSMWVSSGNRIQICVSEMLFFRLLNFVWYIPNLKCFSNRIYENSTVFYPHIIKLPPNDALFCPQKCIS